MENPGFIGTISILTPSGAPPLLQTLARRADVPSSHLPVSVFVDYVAGAPTARVSILAGDRAGSPLLPEHEQMRRMRSLELPAATFSFDMDARTLLAALGTISVELHPSDGDRVPARP